LQGISQARGRRVVFVFLLTRNQGIEIKCLANVKCRQIGAKYIDKSFDINNPDGSEMIRVIGRLCFVI
jgi:hypothetical protein